MQRYEYRVIPAPRKGKKAKGLRSGEDRFAGALTDCMNDMAAKGWEYQRTDTLPAEERSGLTGKTTVFQNMLVFRRAVEPATDQADVTATPTVAVTDIAGVHAPKLPSAARAQDVTSSVPAPSPNGQTDSQPATEAPKDSDGSRVQAAE